eukprot:26907-Eustigmatos_ZCMA.PRE.1
MERPRRVHWSRLLDAPMHPDMRIVSECSVPRDPTYMGTPGEVMVVSARVMFDAPMHLHMQNNVDRADT